MNQYADKAVRVSREPPIDNIAKKALSVELYYKKNRAISSDNSFIHVIS